jgi:hypothetical protein
LAGAAGDGSGRIPIRYTVAREGYTSISPDGLQGNSGEGRGRFSGLAEVQERDRVKDENRPVFRHLRAHCIAQIESGIPLGGGLQTFGGEFPA